MFSETPCITYYSGGTERLWYGSWNQRFSASAAHYIALEVIKRKVLNEYVKSFVFKTDH